MQSDEKQLEKILKVRLHDAFHRSLQKQIPFDLTLDGLKEMYDKQDGLCAITGFPMELVPAKRQMNPYCLSIDRIDSNGGYVSDNVQLVCTAANTMKGNLDYEELNKFCKAIIINNYDATCK